MKKCKSTQVFIFRTNKLQEIVGGFGIIRDLFSDFLFPAARDVEGVEEASGYTLISILRPGAVRLSECKECVLFQEGCKR